MKGFFIGAQLNGSAVVIDDFMDEAESGSGFGVHLGYGFTPKLAAFVDLTGAALDDGAGGSIGFGHFDLGLRYAWTSPIRRFVPSLDFAISGRALAQDDVLMEDGSVADMSLDGNGFTFGGNVEYYFTPKFSMGLGLKWTRGEFDRATVDDLSRSGLDWDATSSRFNLFATWHPRGGR